MNQAPETVKSSLDIVNLELFANAIRVDSVSEKLIIDLFRLPTWYLEVVRYYPATNLQLFLHFRTKTFVRTGSKIKGYDVSCRNIDIEKVTLDDFHFFVQS